MKDVRLL